MSLVASACAALLLISAGHAQVVIARVLSVDHNTRRLRLSLAAKTGNPVPAAGDAAEALQPGDLVEGVVTNITSKEVSLQADAVLSTNDGKDSICPFHCPFHLSNTAGKYSLLCFLWRFVERGAAFEYNGTKAF